MEEEILPQFSKLLPQYFTINVEHMYTNYQTNKQNKRQEQQQNKQQKIAEKGRN